MGLGYPLGDGESQAHAGPPAGAGASDIRAPEPIEDVFQIAGRDADARVADDEDDPRVVVLELDIDASFLRGVLDGVGEEVQEQLPDPTITEPYV